MGTKNPKWWVGWSLMVAYMSIPRECFAKISEFLKKKLAEGSVYLVYNGIYNDNNLQKTKIFILDTKTHLYELICHPHIDADQT